MISRNWNKTLSIILIIVLLGLFGVISYTYAGPQAEDSFTEFYLKGTGYSVENYPEVLTLGEKGEVTVGIINRQHETVTYVLEVIIAGIKDNEVNPVVLDHNEKWEEILCFTPDKRGDNQKVEFLLYKKGQGEVYQNLYLCVDVN
ncbi:MAG: DUF1616 domain-containing protein [Dehalococcoidales bacterium]|nr:DUF1616 domain-containing protein [Dehalococcoidales bacterium]